MVWQMENACQRRKTQIVHFHPKRYKRTDFKWKFGNAELKTEESYKYLGVYLHEKMNFDLTSDILSSAGSKALGQLRYKLRFLKECQYETFTKLYSFCIVPILDYASSARGFKFYGKPETIQHRAIPYFLGYIDLQQTMWLREIWAGSLVEHDGNCQFWIIGTGL